MKMNPRGHPATSIATAHTPADKPITFHIDTGPAATAHTYAKAKTDIHSATFAG